MDIIVCYKIAPYEQSIAINPDRTLSFADCEYTVGQYDLNAVEAGARLAEAHGGTVTALTVGAEEVENTKLRKSVLSRGPHSCCTVNDPKLKGADSWTVAATLAEAVKTLGNFDLILCGEGSSDLYSQQVGIILGEMLGIPALNAVGDIALMGKSSPLPAPLKTKWRHFR
jgi:electron transfer flavoprotein beta subunit